VLRESCRLRNGVARTVPFLMIRMAPLCSTTNSRVVSPGGAVRKMGLSNPEAMVSRPSAGSLPVTVRVTEAWPVRPAVSVALRVIVWWPGVRVLSTTLSPAPRAPSMVLDQSSALSAMVAPSSSTAPPAKSTAVLSATLALSAGLVMVTTGAFGSGPGRGSVEEQATAMASRPVRADGNMRRIGIGTTMGCRAWDGSCLKTSIGSARPRGW
jgi:hypothetical protein